MTTEIDPTHPKPLHVRLGITYRQLDHYVRRGYLRVASPGSGRDRVFTEQELRIAQRMISLIRTGFTVAAAAAYARAQIEHEWTGLLQLHRDGKLTAWGMLRETGYPRYPFSLDEEPANSVSEGEGSAGG